MKFKLFKILIIEDDPVYEKIISHILENTGQNIQILKSNNGFDALELLQKETPDLILTDWEMPKMSGIEFCNKIYIL